VQRCIIPFGGFSGNDIFRSVRCRPDRTTRAQRSCPKFGNALAQLHPRRRWTYRRGTIVNLSR